MSLRNLRNVASARSFITSRFIAPPAGRKYGRTHGSMGVTDDIADRLLRLPLWPDMASAADDICAQVIDAVQKSLA